MNVPLVPITVMLRMTEQLVVTSSVASCAPVMWGSLEMVPPAMVKKYYSVLFKGACVIFFLIYYIIIFLWLTFL